MSWNFGRKLTSMFGLVVEALETISKLTATTSDDRAVDALRAIGAVVETLKAGFEGKISLEACEHAMADLRAQLAGNDALADEALADKFPAG
jgi:hypothetical protein